MAYKSDEEDAVRIDSLAEEAAKAEWAKSQLAGCLPWAHIDPEVRRLKVDAQRWRFAQRLGSPYAHELLSRPYPKDKAGG